MSAQLLFNLGTILLLN